MTVRVSLQTLVTLFSALIFSSDIIADNPVMLKNVDVTADESGAFVKAISLEPQIRSTFILSPYTKKELKILDYVNTLIALESFTESFNPSDSSDGALPQHLYGQVAGEDDHEAESVASYLNATTPRSQQLQGQGNSATNAENDEWESWRLLKRNVQEGTMNINYDEETHDCSGTSWGTLSDCWRSLKHKTERIAIVSRANRLKKADVDD